MRTDFIDLLAVLSKFERINKIKVYGRAESEIKSPKALASSVVISDNLRCVRFNIFAVDLSDCKDITAQLGIESITDDNIFFANGSLATFIQKDVPLEDWYCIDGILTLSKRTKSPVAAMFNFHKSSLDNLWHIHETKIYDLPAEKINKTGRVFDYLCKSATLNTILLPEEVLSCSKCLADEPDILAEFGGVSLQSTPLSAVSDLSEIESDKDTVGREKDKLWVLTNRDSIVGVTDNFRRVASSVSGCKGLRARLVNTLKSKYPLIEGAPSDYVVVLLKGLVENMKRQAQYGHSGASLVKEYLASMVTSNSYKPYLGSTVEQYILNIFESIVDYAITGSKDDFYADSECMSVIEDCFSEPEYCYAGILAQIVGCDQQTLINIAIYCASVGISFSKMVNDTPYWLGFMSNELNFAVIEHLAICLQLNEPVSEDTLRVKNCSILYSWLIQNASGGISLYDLRKCRLGVFISEKNRVALAQDRYINSSVRSDVITYLKDSGVSESWGYSNMTCDLCNGGVNLLLSSELSIDETVKWLADLGLVVNLNVNNLNTLFLAPVIERAVFVFNKLQTLSANKPYHVYDESKIQEYIVDYCEVFGVSLSDISVSAIKKAFTNNISIVNGRVGSGKTDFLRCLTTIISEYGYSHDSAMHFDISSRRVKVNSKSVPERRDITDALVGCFVSKDAEIPAFEDTYGIGARTLRSVFLGDTRILDNPLLDDIVVRSIDCDWYIFDNMATYSLDTLYLILRSIDNGRVVFIGDVDSDTFRRNNSVFIDLFNMLPSTVLDVTNFQLRKSLTASVTHKLMSGDDLLAYLDSSRYVRCLNVPDKDIVTVVGALSQYHSGGEFAKAASISLANMGFSDLIQPQSELTCANIKIASPVTKPCYNWGSYVLNASLQETMNSRGEAFTIKGVDALSTQVRIGDSIVITKNMPTLQWYSDYLGGNFRKTWGYGVYEGDLGTVVDIIPTYGCTFAPCKTEQPDWYKEPYFALRSDASFMKAGNFFIVVAFKSCEFECNYYVVLRASYVDDNTKCFVGADLRKFELSYCLNPKQLFGTQYDMLILAIGSGNFNNYINRDLLYSLLTVGRRYLYIVGDLEQFKQAINQPSSGIGSVGLLTTLFNPQ